jgi:hypothetical protein
MPTVGRLVAVALIAAFVIWRLVLALSRGRLKLFDPFFWTKPNYASLFDGPVVTRDRNPLGYWFGVVSQIVVSSLFLWIFISMYLTAYFAIGICAVVPVITGIMAQFPTDWPLPRVLLDAALAGDT